MLKLRTFREAFPRFYAATAETAVLVPPLFSLTLGEDVIAMTIDTLLEGQTTAGSVDALLAVSEAIVGDLRDLEVEIAGDERDERILQFIRFIACQAPLNASSGFGLSGQAHDWFYLSITPDHDPSKSYNNGYGFWPIAGVADGRLGQHATDLTPLWLYNLYILARTTSGLGQAAQRYFDSAWDMIKFRIARAPDHEATVLASAAILSWAADVDHARTAELTEFCLALWESDRIPREYATVLGQVFCTQAGDHTGRTQTAWAALLLDNYSDVLREHQRLQLMAVRADTVETWARDRAEILAEIDRLARDIESQAEQMGAPKLYTLESRIEIINPLVHRLVRFGDLEGLLDVLFAWYARPGTARCSGDVLFVCPTHAYGTAYLWPGGTWFAPDRDLEPLNAAVAAAFNQARSTGGTEPHFPPGWSEDRAGTPVAVASQGLEDAVRDHYGLDALADHIPSEVRLRSILTFPTLRDAAPALIARQLDRMLPLEASLGQAAEPRPLRRMSVWAGHTNMTEAEVECLTVAGRAGGFDVEVTSPAEGDLAGQFRTFYEDVDADVLWVIGHGQFDAHSAARSGLQFDYDAVLSWEDLGRMTVPSSGRRLLVLNVCSGAEVKVTGGMARIGVGPELVGETQMVIGQQWAVDGHVALAFGALAASRLAQGQDASAAIEGAIVDLRDPDGVVDRIETALGQVSAVDRLASARMKGFLHWACPAILT